MRLTVYRFQPRNIWFAFLLGGVALALTGCAERATSATENVDAAVVAAANAHPEELLDQMISAYQRARTYSDSGEFHVHAESKDQSENSPAYPFSVAFEQPNKLRVHSMDASVVCDGNDFRASTTHLEDQVLALPAPRPLTLDSIYADRELGHAAQGPYEVSMPQLELLLAQPSLKALLKEGDKTVRLPDRDLDGDMCHRVQVQGPQGTAVYWIDAKRHLLRRYEFPTGPIRAKFDPDSQLTKLEVWADFKGARFDSDLPDRAFAFEAPASAKLLTRFLPPPPAPPSQLLGQPAPAFSFVDLSGKPVDKQSLAGKIVVLDMWATWCGWCFRALPQVEDAYQHFKENDKVAFLAVNTSDPDANDERVQEAFAKAEIHLPIVRDPRNQALEDFKVEGLPAMVVIGADGNVQWEHTGFNPSLARDLTSTLERLLAGEDLAGEAMKKYEEDRRKYEAEIEAALVGKSAVFQVPKAAIAQRNEPTKLKLTKLWTAADVAAPGNLLVVDEESGRQSIFVLDGWREVAELDESGKLVARHDLQVPAEAVISLLRSAVDGRGNRYFVAFASGQQQLRLFDSNWNQILSYPQETHGGIADVQFSDLDHDGSLNLDVGCWGIGGLQLVSLEGQRRWSNRSLENVLRVAVLDSDDGGFGRLLCTNSRGTLVVIDHQGQLQKELRFADRALHAIVAARIERDQPQRLAALSSTSLGHNVALGVGLDGRELWYYALPDGMHKYPVEPLVAGRLLDNASVQWLIPAADGSLHMLLADGTLLDQFNYGSALTGVATARVDDQNVLLISSTDGLTAWRVDSGD